MAMRSSILRKGVFKRNSTILVARVGPMPGSCSSWLTVAVFRSMGWEGGVFFACAGTTRARRNAAEMRARRSGVTSWRAEAKALDESAFGDFRLRLGRVVIGYLAEKCGLLADLSAIADDDDLGVRGIEVATGGGMNILGGKRSDTFR